jgi:hypothetical protein
LNLVTPPDQTGAHAQLLAIERQLNQASSLLSEASAALARLRAQRLDDAQPLRQGASGVAACFKGEVTRLDCVTAEAGYKGEVTPSECVAAESFDLTKPVTAAVT